MADADAKDAAAQQAEITAALSQHPCKVLESTMAEALQALAVQITVLAVHKARQLKDIAGGLCGTLLISATGHGQQSPMAAAPSSRLRGDALWRGVPVHRLPCDLAAALHAEAVKHGMDQKGGKSDGGVYHCVAGKSFASECVHAP